MRIHTPNDLALFIRTYRKKMKLSQGALASSVGLKQQTISAFEQNPTHTKMDTLFRILSAVNLDLTITPRNKNISDTEW